MSEQWLRCNTVSEGMFSDECAIVLKLETGGQISVFVPCESVNQELQRVRVDVFEDKGKSWAVLPDARRTIVVIASGDLVPA